MKKLLLAFLIVLGAKAFAQQKGISYQAVIINPSETPIPGYNLKEPLANKSICISFQILNTTSQIEYQESQTVITDQFGMVNLVIGTGNKTGGTATSLAAVTWGLGFKTLVVGVNITATCSNYTEISRQALNYVPYALYSEESNIKDGSVTTAKLADGSITDAKLATGISKSKVGLSNVDNTSDAAKSISSATQTALDLKEDKANKSNDATFLTTSNTSYPTTLAVKTYVDLKATSAATTITSAQTEINTTQAGAGLATDGSYIANAAANYIATATTLADADNKLDAQLKLNTTAIGTKEDKANKSIDDKFLSTSNTSYPSTLAVKTYVDAQVAGATIADATATVKGKIQLAGDLGGTAAAPTVPGLANKANISSLATVATSGNYNDLSNKPAAYALPTASASALGGVKVGTNLSIDANGILSAAASGNYNDLTNKPTIPAAYALPNASSSALGGVKVGSNLSIDANGVLSAAASGNYNDLSNKPTIPSAYTLPNASATALGGIKVGSNLSIDANGVLSAAATPSDATTTAKGIIKLAGDLAGTGSTADAPIITDGAITTAKLSTTGVTANSYGSATAIPVITVDAKGRITSASTTNISASLTEITDEFLNVGAAQTSFNLSQAPATGTKVKMIINGVVIKGSAHSMLSSTEVVYNPANNGGYNIALGDEVVFYYFVK